MHCTCTTVLIGNLLQTPRESITWCRRPVRRSLCGDLLQGRAPGHLARMRTLLQEARKRFLYCAWGTFGEREREREIQREREREREKDGSDVTFVALKLAMSFAFLLAKNVHLSIDEEFRAIPSQKIGTSVSPLLNGAEFTLSVAKNVALFETVRILRTVKWRDWQGIEAAKQTMEFPAAPFFLVEISKKWIKLIPKTIGNRKKDCAWGCAWGINTTWENLQVEKHKSGRRSFRSPNWFVLFDLQIFSGGVYSPSATSRTISFSISNSFCFYPGLRPVARTS